MRKIIAVLAIAMVAMFGVTVAAQATNHKFPLCHGKNSVPCRPDPQPSHGKDCLKHGKGGVNDDHCSPVVAPSPTPTPTHDPKCHVACSTPTPTPKSPSASHVAKNTPLAVTGVDGPAIVLIAALGLAFLFAGVALWSRNRTSQR